MSDHKDRFARFKPVMPIAHFIKEIKKRKATSLSDKNGVREIWVRIKKTVTNT
jgi:hypothetical protein